MENRPTLRLCSRRREGEAEEEEDRLSSLSEEVLHVLMSFLSIQEAVRTCVLSKIWDSLWRSLPYLHFDLAAISFQPPPPLPPPPPLQPQPQLQLLSLLQKQLQHQHRQQQMRNFIAHLLVRRHSANLVRLRFTSKQVVDSSLVELLIYYAIQHHVQELDIRACSQKPIKFSSCFTCCQLLTTLKLESPKGFHDNGDWYSFNINSLRFPSLQTLHLVKIRARDPNSFYSRILSSSCTPNLQNLKFVHCLLNGINTLSIDAPNLESLEFVYSSYGHFYARGFEVVIDAPKLTRFKFLGHNYPLWSFSSDLPCLDQVVFDLSWGERSKTEEFVEDEHVLNLVYTLTLFSQAKSLTLSFQIIKVLVRFPAFVGASQLRFPNLKFLKLVGASRKQVVGNCDFFMPGSLLDRFLCYSPSVKICQ